MNARFSIASMTLGSLPSCSIPARCASSPGPRNGWRKTTGSMTVASPSVAKMIDEDPARRDRSRDPLIDHLGFRRRNSGLD